MKQRLNCWASSYKAFPSFTRQLANRAIAPHSSEPPCWAGVGGYDGWPIQTGIARQYIRIITARDRLLKASNAPRTAMSSNLSILLGPPPLLMDQTPADCHVASCSTDAAL
jgi:hypothetical protein